MPWVRSMAAVNWTSKALLDHWHRVIAMMVDVACHSGDAINRQYCCIQLSNSVLGRVVVGHVEAPAIAVVAAEGAKSAVEQLIADQEVEAC